MLSISDVNTYYGTTVTKAVINSPETEIIDKIDVNYFRTAKYILQITQSSTYQVIELLLLHDNNNSSLMEYGSISTGEVLANITTFIESGEVKLKVNRLNTSSSMSLLIHRLILRNEEASESITF